MQGPKLVDRHGVSHTMRGETSPGFGSRHWPLPALDLPINSLSIMRCQTGIFFERSSDTPSEGTPRQLRPAPREEKQSRKAHNQPGLYLSQGGVCLRLGKPVAALARRLMDCKVSWSIFEE
jgi:hypothetical protein